MKKIILALALVVVALTANAEKRSVTLHIPGMECNNCKGKVENCLAFEKGVRKLLDFNLEDRTVTVVYEDTKTSVETLQAALVKQLKFDSKVIKLDGQAKAEKEGVAKSTCNHDHSKQGACQASKDGKKCEKACNHNHSKQGACQASKDGKKCEKSCGHNHEGHTCQGHNHE